MRRGAFNVPLQAKDDRLRSAENSNTHCTRSRCIYTENFALFFTLAIQYTE